jgi:hypothetical protein
MTAKPALAAKTRHQMTEVTVQLLEASAADDPVLVHALAAPVNVAYAAAERGLWREQATRTTAAELGRHSQTGEIAVARCRGEIAGIAVSATEPCAAPVSTAPTHTWHRCCPPLATSSSTRSHSAMSWIPSMTGAVTEQST